MKADFVKVSTLSLTLDLKGSLRNSKMVLKQLTHFVIVKSVRFVKFIELQILYLFQGWVESFLRNKFDEMGVAIHIQPPLECKSEKDVWTLEDEKRMLGNTKYTKILHLRFKSKYVFVKIANQGTMALGEGLMDGEWAIDEEDSLPDLWGRFLEAGMMRLYYNPWNKLLNYLEISAFNMQTKPKSPEVAEAHYDLGNDLYQSFLDPWMQYTCGYWTKANNLNEAQVHKMHLIARKLDLKPGMRVLDLGCGWGTLCKFLAANYGVECVGVNIAKEGVRYGQEACKGLPVDIRLQDYRDIDEKFDRVVSIGLMEHVGVHNYDDLFQVANRCLKDDGIFLLHTCGNNELKGIQRSDTFFNTYIFPNGQLPYPIFHILT